MSGSAVELAPWLGVMGFAAIWLAVCFLLSLVGGWQTLARSYPASSRPGGRSLWCRSGSLGWVGYRNCLTFVPSPGGLYLAVLLPFRFGHAPLFVPWQDVSASAKRGWLARSVDLRFAKQPQLRLRLHRGLGEELLAAGGGVVPIRGAG